MITPMTQPYLNKSENSAQPQLSSRKRRIVAFVIDHFILSFIIVSGIFLILGPEFIEGNVADFTSKILICIPIGLFIYFAKDSFGGVSIGKWIMGIMVRDDKDSSIIPSFGRLFLRNAFIAIWPVEFIVMAINDDKKRIGDKVAKTYVIKNPAKQSIVPKVFTMIALFIIVITFIILFAGSALKTSGAYKVAIREIAKDQSIINETGGIVDYGTMPSGNISISNGYGRAVLKITAIGKNKKEITVNTFLTKEPEGEWKIVLIKRE